MRIEEIEIKIGYIHDAMNEVVNHLPGKLGEFMQLGMIKHGIYKKVEFALQNVIDICSVIHADMDLGVPESEDDILNNLEKNKVFTPRVITIIREMKGFRNVLVHRYGEIDDTIAFNTLKEDTRDFNVVVKAFETLLKEENPL